MFAAQVVVQCFCVGSLTASMAVLTACMCMHVSHPMCLTLLLDTHTHRLELEQERKWVVENQVDQQELVVTVKDPKQIVYIYNCSGSVVQVREGGREGGRGQQNPATSRCLSL